MNLDIQKFNDTVAEAKRKAPHIASHIDAAAQMLLENPHIEEVGGGLRIVSETTSKVYFAGLVCQCDAWKYGKMCRHRVAARLVQGYNEH